MLKAKELHYEISGPSRKTGAEIIRRLPKDEKERILREIYRLPDEGDIRPLKVRRGKGYFRLRVGSYRIIYTVNDEKLVVMVVDVGNRGGRFIKDMIDRAGVRGKNDKRRGQCTDLFFFFLRLP